MTIPLSPPHRASFLSVIAVQVLSAHECDRVLDMLPQEAWKDARVTQQDNSYGAVDPEIRSVLSQPLPVDAAGWPMAQIVDAIGEANGRAWTYELSGFARHDHPSVLRYESSTQDHFRPHLDAGEFAPSRKLSFSLQLSDPATYRGGELIIGGSTLSEGRRQGWLTIFSSLSLHEVTPVYSGIRHAIVGWVHGPTFR